MSNFLHLREFFSTDDFVRVTTDTQCNLRFLTDSEFSDYRQGRSFNAYSVNVRMRLTTSKPPRSGVWNVVVDTKGYSSGARASLVYIKAA